ncbi:MAG TPA: hypothetical protein RMH85_33180 [Polyangiaceae bacterium LLY-WYZ-15_(1-7)]|nr:hypothetical protein [Myxococcales bacterium]MAT23678.1 hypothetical protein [Sandaracinus sp.]HJK93233.1 hypothetical protein [Polyangiaceae bacterium LLY-WYZ-15_(1-7)]MBJ69767.1 hypothetical protein [Sandaracinus sp.]HJL02121.1 hypothetical protein [Polyangiaceae bacterium LLY-WYZ-15_(1-7)]
MRRHLFAFALFALAPLAGCFGDDDAGYYQSCADGEQCLSDTTCFTVAFERDRDGAMCTANCETDADCPFGGACFGLVGDPVEQRVCFERCRDDRDCPPEFLCANAERDGEIVDAICLPR